jgi:outer membrane protein
MKMRRFLSGLLIFLGLSLTALPADETAIPGSLTLEDVVRIVLARNPSLKEAEDTVAVFEARVAESRTGLLPNLRGSLSYSRIGPLETLDVPGLGSFNLFPADNYDVHAGVRQIIYDGGRIKETVKLAQSQVASAEDRGELLKRDLAFQTAQLFDAILFLRESLRVQNDHVRTLNDHIGIARKKVAAGTATELEVLNTQVRVVSARNQIVDLENALEKQELALRRLMGLETAAPLELRGGFEHNSLALEPDTLVTEAFRSRPETQALENLIRTADLQVRVAGLHDRPTLSLNVLGGAKNGYIPNLKTWKLNYVAAVQADIPIFDGRLGRALKAEAEAGLTAIKNRTRELEDMIRSEVLQAVSDVRASEEKLRSVEVNIEQAQKALEFARARYEAGTITNLDLLDTEDAFVEAEFLRLRALYQLVLSRTALDRATGRPIPDGTGRRMTCP